MTTNTTTIAWQQKADWLRKLSKQYWIPLATLIATMAFGLMTAGWMERVPGASFHPALPLADVGKIDSPHVDYKMAPLEQVLENEGWLGEGWRATWSGRSGVGYVDHPVTFRFSITNTTMQNMSRLIVVSAPFLDQITPVRVNDSGMIERMPSQGDTYPAAQRMLDLPLWVWPVQVAPQSTATFLYEVSNRGPVMLPVQVASPESFIEQISPTLMWKSVIMGMLLFALLGNSIVLFMLRRRDIAWLSVLLIGVIHTQLVMDGFGLWLVWPSWPEFSKLMLVTGPLCLIAICQFSQSFLQLQGRARQVLRTLSVAGVLLIVATPLELPLFGQGTLLLISTFACVFILYLSLQRFREQTYARYFTLAIISLLVGVLVVSLRTIGYVPVNSLTNSGFYLGSTLASIIFTVASAHMLLDERKQRLQASMLAARERGLRTQIESDYGKLQRTHRVTGHPNRPIIEESLDQLHHKDEPYTLCVLRLNRYVEIEQSVGYQSSEEMLRTYLNQVEALIERIFGDQLISLGSSTLGTIDTISHVFAVRGDQHHSIGTDKWLMLRNWLNNAFRTSRYDFNWNVAVGMAYAPKHGLCAADMLSRAGFASLNNTRRLVEYDSNIADRQKEQKILMLDLETALNNGQIYLEYQPKVLIETGEVVSCEALIRWKHPEFGNVSPVRWIPLAEQLGTINTVTAWAIAEVSKNWPTLCKRFGRRVAVSVNISARDLDLPAFDQRALSIVRKYRMQPEYLILEITETAVMADVEQARIMLSALGRAGFRLSLDDFGTGYSSLSALARFDLDELKIDRSFLANILHDATRMKIFRMALELAEALNLSVVVEGVETEDVAQWLVQYPNLYGQGYYWAKPLPMDAITPGLLLGR